MWLGYKVDVIDFKSWTVSSFIYIHIASYLDDFKSVLGGKEIARKRKRDGKRMRYRESAEKDKKNSTTK